MLQKVIILSDVSYGCEMWSLALRQEHKTQVFENKMLKKIFTPEKGEVHEQFSILLTDKSQ
jgi:hypothetical protein